MTTFPSLTTSTSELTLGAAAPESVSTLAGGNITTLADLVAVGGTLLMSFEGLTETQANSIRTHCAGQAGASFPFSTTTVPAGDTPVGFAWIYDAPPQVSDVRAVAGSEFYSVACTFRAIRLRRAVPPSFTARLNITTTAPLALNPTPSFAAALNITTAPAVVAPLWVPTALDLWFENPTSVSTWTGLANSRNLVQATSSQQPTLNATALNGLPALTFDGSDDLMACAAAGTSGVSNCSMFLVMRYNASGQNLVAGLGPMGQSTDAIRSFYRASGSTQGFTTFANDINSSSLSCDNGGSFHIWSVVQNGSSVTLARDGVTASYTLPGGAPSAMSGNGAFLAGFIASQFSYYYASVSVAAWLVEYRAISGADRERYEGYLADRYWRVRGVAVPLDSGHPYYSTPPTV